MKNILFPTVRQGNCGDEFILFGVINILNTLEPEYNPVILNKNVEVCRRLALRNRNMSIETKTGERVSINIENLCFSMGTPIYDDSLHDNSLADYHDLDFIDAVVFAGTPEWMGFKLDPLYKKLESFEGPIIFLGPGYHEGFAKCGPYSGFKEKKIHQKASAFIVRDRRLQEFLKPDLIAHLLPCPALLCSKKERERSIIKKIGFSLQAKYGDARVNFVPETTYDFSLKLLEVVSRKYDVEVVCHWIEDLIWLKKAIGDRYPLRYSFDAKEYLDIYDRYDLVVSTRVHGSGMAASLGIPSFTIAHSLRSDTVKGFLSEIITTNDDPGSVLDAIRSYDIPENSRRIIAHKKATLNAYQSILAPFFPL